MFFYQTSKPKENMQPFDNNNKRNLPEGYDLVNAQPVSKKTRFSDDTNIEVETETDECAQKVFKSYENAPSPPSEKMNEMEFPDLTEQYINLPQIWHHAYHGNWPAVQLLLDTVSSEDLKACPQAGPNQYITLGILAVLNNQWDVVLKIANRDVNAFCDLFKCFVMNERFHDLKRLIEGCSLKKINKNLFNSLLHQVTQYCYNVHKSDHKGLIFFDYDEGGRPYSVNENLWCGFVCLNLCIDKFSISINNEEFNEIAALLFEFDDDPRNLGNLLDEVMRKRKLILNEDLHLAIVRREVEKENPARNPIINAITLTIFRDINFDHPELQLKTLDIFISKSCATDQNEGPLIRFINTFLNLFVVKTSFNGNQKARNDLENMLTKFVIARFYNSEYFYNIISITTHILRLIISTQLPFRRDKYQTIYNKIVETIEKVCDNKSSDVSCCLEYLFLAGLKTPESSIMQTFNRISAMSGTTENDQRLPNELVFQIGMNLIEEELPLFHKHLSRTFLEKQLKLFLNT